MDEGPMTPFGVPLKRGQRWKERDSRVSRVVEVTDWTTHNGPVKVEIKSVRFTWASITRFSGKSGGYVLVD